MNADGFNLVTQPWLPCQSGDGAVVELSLSETLERAPELCRLVAGSPLTAFALHRILLAVVHAAIRGPKSLVEARELYAAGRFDDGVFDYLKTWSGRFDLFAKERPWFQPAPDPGAAPKTIAVLVHERAAGHNATLFDHSVDAAPPNLTPAEAAQALVTSQAFAVGGGVSRPFNLVSAPSTAHVLGLIEGQSLFDTLMLNLVRYDGIDAPIPVMSEDTPCWERGEDDHPDRAGTRPRGWLDYLTWQPRAIKLLREEGGHVARCVVSQHLRMATPAPMDPAASYRSDAKAGRKALRVRSDRALWRDLDAILIGLTGHSDLHPTGVVSWAHDLRDLDAAHPRLVATGLELYQARIERWAQAQTPLSEILVEDPDRLDALSCCLKHAEGAAIALSKCARTVHKERQSKPPTRFPEIASYWGSLDPVFARLAAALADPAEPVDTSMATWSDAVRRLAGSACDRMLSPYTTGAPNLRAAARARRVFIMSLPPRLGTAVLTSA
jgi:CRISPR system Cascade subunit CasA